MGPGDPKNNASGKFWVRTGEIRSPDSQCVSINNSTNWLVFIPGTTFKDVGLHINPLLDAQRKSPMYYNSFQNSN